VGYWRAGVAYSGIYGLGCFPFHTDLAHWRVPPHYLLLRCMTGYSDVPTLLVDGQALIDAVTLDVLIRAIFMPRRPRNGANLFSAPARNNPRRTTAR
jgi:L-asparagine oxygenase